jgi:hypothetical protein
MVDYLKIKLKNQYGSNVIIGSQKYFDNAYISYEIIDFDVISYNIVKLSIDDSVIVKNLELLAKSIYYFYNNTDPVTSVLVEKFQNSTLKILFRQILERLPLLNEFEITDLEYGFSLEKPNSRAEIELTTCSLFKDCKINKSSYTYHGLTEKEINSKSNNSDFSVNVVLSEDFKRQFKNVVF